MVETAIKQKAINYIETLDDEQTLQVITYIEKMPKKKPLQNSKTPEERAAAQRALDDIFAMSRPEKRKTSLDGRKEIAQALWRKYESLD